MKKNLTVEEFLTECETRYGRDARISARKILDAALERGYLIECYLTDGRNDARATISIGGYGIFSIFAATNSSVKDAIFVIRATNDFERNHKDVAAKFIPLWKKAVYDVNFKYGAIPVSREKALERACMALSGYAEIVTT